MSKLLWLWGWVRSLWRLLFSTAGALLLLAPAARAQEGGVLRRAAYYEPYLRQAGALQGVDWRLLWTIGYLETKFSPAGAHRLGARGLMQLMPATARRFGLQNPYDPWGSIDAAARYVRFLEERFGRSDLVLAGYNAGELAVEAYLTGRAIRLSNGKVINPSGKRTNGVPEYRETVNYVADGMRVLAVLGGRGSETGPQVAEVVSEEFPPRRGMVRASLYFNAGDRAREGERTRHFSADSLGENVPSWLRPSRAAGGRPVVEVVSARGKNVAGARAPTRQEEKPSPAAEPAPEPGRKQPTRSLYVHTDGESPGN